MMEIADRFLSCINKTAGSLGLMSIILLLGACSTERDCVDVHGYKYDVNNLCLLSPDPVSIGCFEAGPGGNLKMGCFYSSETRVLIKTAVTVFSDAEITELGYNPCSDLGFSKEVVLQNIEDIKLCEN